MELIDKNIIIASIVAVVILTIGFGAAILIIIKWNLREGITKGSKAANTIINALYPLEFVTLLTVIAALLLLALTDKLTEGILSLFSGVIGYVLGSYKRRLTANNSDEAPND